MTKTHGGSTPIRTVAPKLLTGGTPGPPIEKKSTFVGSTSNYPTVDQYADDKKKGAMDNEVLVDPNNTDKKVHLSTELNTK
jgi:hypothetical protein